MTLDHLSTQKLGGLAGEEVEGVFPKMTQAKNAGASQFAIMIGGFVCSDHLFSFGKHADLHLFRKIVLLQSHRTLQSQPF